MKNTTHATNATNATPKYTEEQCIQIIESAFQAAHQAAKTYLETHGERQYDLNCGYGWVTIRPARGTLCRILKESYKAFKGWKGGVVIWQPSCVPSQNMYVHQEGAIAFAKVLQEAGYDAVWDSRLD